MKRLAINVSICLVSFGVGVATASLLNWMIQPAKTVQPQIKVAVAKDQPPPATVSEPAEPPVREAVFAGGWLRIVPAEVNLKSERLRYEIAVTYPQIAGSKDLYIRKLNKRIKQLVNSHYQWPLNPSKAELRRYRKDWPDVLNSVYLDYDVSLANDSFLSIYFNGYSYGIGAAHSVQFSFVVNYNLTLRKELKLSDLFTPRSKYLEYLTHYCENELSKQSESTSRKISLAPENLESWSLTNDALHLNFDPCSVFGCADGQKHVEIPFADIKSSCASCGFTRTATRLMDRPW